MIINTHFKGEREREIVHTAQVNNKYTGNKTERKEKILRMRIYITC